MASPAGLPCAVFIGKCSGHGICVPLNVHSVEPCGTECGLVKTKKSVAVMNATNMWASWPQTPLAVMTTVFNVVVNGNIPIVDQDALINHPSKCTQLIKFQGCDPIPAAIVCPTGSLCIEDVAGGGGHVRVAKATCATVFMNGRRACRVADPLGPPCLSLIATGAVNVLIGV